MRGRFVRFVLGVVLCVVPASAPRAETVVLAPEAGGTYVLDRSHANVLFRINHLGYSQYMGRFNTLDAKLTLDAQDLAKSQLTATITPAGVDVNNPELQDKLRAADFFNVAQYPEIRFVSRKIVRTGRNTGTVTGDLTLLDATRPLTLNVTFNNGGMNPYASVYTLGFSATGTLKRSEWGMKALVPHVSDDVTLTIEAEFHKEK